ncbi:SseB family protein [Solibaculum mannosilyticum]|uniref:SseB protein N-terminal domain-containing protein n=1 Tax=Solibaculum mannosilyticum TaxID=2780922 RepID=A0A7I8D2D9_9FIRM|nr:SseB family protein [Solibaculum mannosilyticum]BCI59403.1 hypothetical protein C12CBH8_00420 [Solibaculum mannosilyticum]
MALFKKSRKKGEETQASGIDQAKEQTAPQKKIVVGGDETTSPDMMQVENLEFLIRIYMKDPENMVNLVPVLIALGKANVTVPVHVELSEEDAKKLQEGAENGTSIALPENAKARVNILSAPDGRYFLPVYTRKELLPQQAGRRFMAMQTPFLNCCEMILEQMKSASGIAINPYTENLILPPDVLKAVRKKAMEDEQKKQSEEQK